MMLPQKNASMYQKRFVPLFQLRNVKLFQEKSVSQFHKRFVRMYREKFARPNVKTFTGARSAMNETSNILLLLLTVFQISTLPIQSKYMFQESHKH